MKWYLTDDDCSQYIRNDGTLYEMIEIIRFDVTEEDKNNGGHKYVVIINDVDMDDIYSEEIEHYIAPYGYTLGTIYKEYSEEEAKNIIAECILEESAYEGNFFNINEFDTFEEAEAFIKDYISK